MKINAFVETKHGRGQLLEIVPPQGRPKGAAYGRKFSSSKQKAEESYIIKFTTWKADSFGTPTEVDKVSYRWITKKDFVI